jgi:tetratricopeptide (TPR) repeat protein
VSTPNLHRRPLWAAQLDPLVRALGRVLRLMAPRPTDDHLDQLARKDRPAPPVVIPSAADLGLVDHLGEGRAAFADGRYGEALHSFGEHALAYPTDAWGWHGRGDALQLLGEHQDALEAYDKAAQLGPREPLHRAGRANALRGLGRFDEADAAVDANFVPDHTLGKSRG